MHKNTRFFSSFPLKVNSSETDKNDLAGCYFALVCSRFYNIRAYVQCLDVCIFNLAYFLEFISVDFYGGEFPWKGFQYVHDILNIHNRIRKST